MATRRFASSISKQTRPQTALRTAVVTAVLPPSTSESDVVTGWQVVLDFGGGEIKNAGVASSYNPVPGDIVVVARYLNHLFVIDKVTAGASGEEPTSRTAYAYVQTPGTYVTAAAAATDVAIPDLTVVATMKAGAAYNVRLRTGYSGNVANTWALFRLRQNAANSGIDIGEYFRSPVTTASLAYGFDATLVLRNDTSVDLDVTIVPTLTASATGNATAFCTAQSRAFIEVTVIGSSSLYPYAAAVQAPADLT